MDIDKYMTVANDLIDKYLPGGEWFADVNNRKRACGFCEYRKKKISLSKFYIENNPDTLIINTILHEIAHALAPFHGHDDTWKKQAVVIGCTPKRVNETAVMPKDKKYTGTCPICGKTWQRHRRCVGGKCPTCKAIVIWKENA